MINELIDIRFSYNGNLGVLQQKTKDNKSFCNRLLQNKVISIDEYKQVMQEIHEYFITEINKVLANPISYIDTL